jgi:hypothetical protein
MAQHPEYAFSLFFEMIQNSVCTGAAVFLVSVGACWLTHLEHPILTTRSR